MSRKEVHAWYEACQFKAVINGNKILHKPTLHRNEGMEQLFCYNISCFVSLVFLYYKDSDTLSCPCPSYGTGLNCKF